jgi:hypothetical protein
MFQNLKYVNDLNWIQAEYTSGEGCACLEPGDPLYDRALSGEFGAIAAYDGPSASDIVAAEVKALRDKMLSASDWTQVPDAPVDAAAWATYRQALRDIPQQAGFPENITWPEAPA